MLKLASDLWTLAPLAASAIASYPRVNSSSTNTRLNRPLRSSMSYYPRPPYRRAYRKAYRRSYARIPKRVPDSRITSFSRTTSPSAYQIGANTYVAGVLPVYLGQIFTTDLLASFDAYRIKGVTFKMHPRIDTANSGLSNNYNWEAYAACDTTGTFTAPASAYLVCQFANYKYAPMESGKHFTYKCYPKPLNSIDNAGTAAAVGEFGKMNPWLTLSTTGISIPHYQLVFWLGGTASTTQYFDFTWTIDFDCIRSR